MAAGIIIYNDSGTVQIDDTSPTLGMESKVTTSTVSNTLSLAGLEFPVCALRCVDWVAPGQSSASSLYYRRTASSTASITAYTFARPKLVSNYGLHVRDASGKITFDALQSPGRVVHVFTSSGTFNGVSGRTYAVIVATPRFNEHWDLIAFDAIENTWEKTEFMAASKVSGSVVQVDFRAAMRVITEKEPLQAGNLSSDTWQSGMTGLALVMDVTGY